MSIASSASPRVLLVALVVTASTSCAGEPAPPTGPPGAATVVRPVDGDTVVVRIGGAQESVRLIGIDTPESVAPNRPVECYGPEAKSRLAALLPKGTVVMLERDVETRDAYNRLLAYVIRAEDGLFVNLALVDEGYAESFPYAPNLAHRVDFDRAEQTARGSARGLWPTCGGTDVPIERPPR